MKRSKMYQEQEGSASESTLVKSRGDGDGHLLPEWLLLLRVAGAFDAAVRDAPRFVSGVQSRHQIIILTVNRSAIALDALKMTGRWNALKLRLRNQFYHDRNAFASA
jgi:hypothetical protein